MVQLSKNDDNNASNDMGFSATATLTTYRRLEGEM